MDELVVMRRKEAMTTSLMVADAFGKRHDRVLRAIDNLVEDLPKNGVVKMFHESTQEDAKGEQRKMYYMNRDGFTLLAMGFTGKKALEFKLKYIAAFNKMEKFITEKQSAEYLEARAAGKRIRREETDAIKELTEYAKEQGSQHPEKYYKIYSDLANKIAGVKKREQANITQIATISVAEKAISTIIKQDMSEGYHYKDIYKDAKDRTQPLKDISVLTVGGEAT
jgi:Rha family phage regulatory protein